MQSDTFLSFLDEESSEGNLLDFDYLMRDIITFHDVLLEHEPPVKKIVMANREYSAPVKVKSESIVVWSFKTIKRDIGFSVHYNEQEVVREYGLSLEAYCSILKLHH